MLGNVARCRSRLQAVRGGVDFVLLFVSFDGFDRSDSFDAFCDVGGLDFRDGVSAAAGGGLPQALTFPYCDSPFHPIQTLNGPP
jgi:hypothetical protein